MLHPLHIFVKSNLSPWPSLARQFFYINEKGGVSNNHSLLARVVRDIPLFIVFALEQTMDMHRCRPQSRNL